MSVREKLIDILKQAPFEGKVLDEWWWEEKIKMIADHLIANGVTVQKWISVKDRLPRKEEYIATADDGTEYYVRFLIAYKTDTVEYEIGYYDGYKWMTEMPIRTIKNVMAWMLFPNMPQSPKGE